MALSNGAISADPAASRAAPRAGVVVSAVAGTEIAQVASEYCPRCSARLAPRSCKLICVCGYYMSCSDFI